jgi:hypothetical protein
MLAFEPVILVPIVVPLHFSFLSILLLTEITYTAWCETGTPPPGFEHLNDLYPAAKAKAAVPKK